MGSDGRYSLALLAWVAGLGAAMWALLWTWSRPDLGVARVLAAMLLLLLIAGLFRHVERSNLALARFVEALRHGDFSSRFDLGGQAGFAELGQALDGAMRSLQAERSRSAEELRFLSALVDDMPVALLTLHSSGPVRLANKAARRLLGAKEILAPDDLAALGSTFVSRLTEPAAAGREVLILRLPEGPQRVLLRIGTLDRLGVPVRVITIEPVQSTLDAAEVAAQTDLVRVLTHEILNSLTPVTSLGETAAALLASEPPDLNEARAAVTTLARRAAGLHQFVKSYRAVASPPVVRKRRFDAVDLAAELDRLFRAEWPEHRLHLEVAPGLVIDADPDLLAQALLNLLRNAAQATGPGGQIVLRIADSAGDGVLIEVEDDGPGVPHELRREIFLPFFTTRLEGTGVGLNLVRQIMVAHGWNVDVTSGRLGGALFRFTGKLSRR
jgi:two-component system, NtrC family, nitrogen regulation sensor histidine kinase NtrY